MMSARLVLAVALAVVTISSGAHAQPGKLPAPPNQVVPLQEMQERSDAILERDLAFMIAPVKSRAALEHHLKEAGDSSPLKALSTPARLRFIDSLTFSAKGLSGFDSQDMVSELTAKQAYRILALFGEQHVTPMMKNLRVEDQIDREILAKKTPLAGEKCGTYPFCTGGDPLGDYEDMKCESHGTCAYDLYKICTSNC